MNRLIMTPQEFCTFHHACQDGKDFALQFQSMADVWDTCPRIAWLLWMYDRTGVPRDDRALRLFAVWCARSVSHLLTDPRSLAAIGTAERYANGQAAASATWAASAASAASAAASAASAAASAASAAAASASQCDQFRKLIPNPFKGQE